MSDYPLLFNVTGQLCVVVGGGTVGSRKVRGLLNSGARVRLIAPEGNPVFQDVPSVEVIARNFCPADLDGACLAFAATDDRAVNAAVAAAARERGIPVNITDDPAAGDFTLPATLQRGNLSISVATAGESPLLAVVLRDLLAEQFGKEWGAVVAIAAALRRKKLTPGMKNFYNPQVLQQLLAAGLPQLLATGDIVAVDRLLTEHLGPSWTLAALDVRLSEEMI